MKFVFFVLFFISSLSLNADSSFANYNYEEEFKNLHAISKKPRVTLSEGIQELVKGVAEEHFNEDFIKKIAELESKKFDGEYLDYWDNGQIKFKATFDKGIAHGHFHGWYKEGYEAFKGYLDHGYKLGVHIVFFPPRPFKDSLFSSKARIITYNRKSQFHGIQHVISPIYGELKISADYRNGLLHGEKSFWDGHRSGESLEKSIYKNGTLQKTIKRNSST